MGYKWAKKAFVLNWTIIYLIITIIIAILHTYSSDYVSFTASVSKAYFNTDILSKPNFLGLNRV